MYILRHITIITVRRLSSYLIARKGLPFLWQAFFVCQLNYQEAIFFFFAFSARFFSRHALHSPVVLSMDTSDIRWLCSDMLHKQHFLQSRSMTYLSSLLSINLHP